MSLEGGRPAQPEQHRTDQALRYVTSLYSSRAMPELDQMRSIGARDMLSAVYATLNTPKVITGQPHLVTIAAAVAAQKDQLALDPPKLLLDYLDTVQVALPKAIVHLVAIGRNVAPCFPHSAESRKRLVDTWRLKQPIFTNTKIEYSGALIQLQLAMLADGETPNEDVEPSFAYVHKVRTVAAEFSSRFKKEKLPDAFKAIALEGVKLGVPEGTISVLLGIPRKRVHEFISN